MKIIDDKGKEVKIEDIKKVIIKEEEFLFVRIETDCTFENFDIIKKNCKNLFPKNKVIVVGPGISIYKGKKII